MTDVELIDVELTAGQHESLMRLTEPNEYQQPRVKDLRAALDSTRQLRTGRHLVRMTEAMIDSASYVLRVAALKGGKSLMHSRAFDREWILNRRNLTARERLLVALESGAEIREVATYTKVEYRPGESTTGSTQAVHDYTPWQVYDAGLRRHFRLRDNDVQPVWPLAAKGDN